MVVLTTNSVAHSGPGARADSRFFETWARIGILYKDALDASAQEWVLSSAHIVQEHTLRAMVAASQSCSQALAQNAASVQQKTVHRLLTANKRAAEIMAQTWIDAMTGNAPGTR